MLAIKNKKEYQKQQNNILPKIEDVFPDRDAVQAKFSNPKAVKVIGIDLGEVFTVLQLAAEPSQELEILPLRGRRFTNRP